MTKRWPHRCWTQEPGRLNVGSMILPAEPVTVLPVVMHSSRQLRYGLPTAVSSCSGLTAEWSNSTEGALPEAGRRNPYYCPLLLFRSSGIQSNISIDTSVSRREEHSLLCARVRRRDGSLVCLVCSLGDRNRLSSVSPADEMHGNSSHRISVRLPRRLYLDESESGKFQVYVQTIPLSDKKWQVSTSGVAPDRAALARRRARASIYPAEDRKPMAVEVRPRPSFGIPRILFKRKCRQAFLRTG